MKRLALFLAFAGFAFAQPELINQRLRMPVIGTYTINSLPRTGLRVGAEAVVNDALTAGSCTTGGGAALSLCRWSGAVWASLGGSGGGGASGQIIASDYNFAAQTPGGTLTAATPATIALNPVPRGVNHDDAAHYLYVSAGTGTAEAVLITGGAGHGGDATGTITFTPANNHSGAWTVASATGGASEAQQACGVGNSCEIYFSEAASFYAPVTALTSGTIMWRGKSKDYFAVSRGAGFTSGNMFSNPSATTYWIFRDLGIDQGVGASSGTAINLSGAYGTNHLYEVKIQSGQFGIVLNGTGYTRLSGVTVGLYDFTFKAVAALWVTGGAINTFITDSLFGSGTDDANVVSYGTLIDRADGIWVVNSGFSGDTSIGINATNPNYTVNLQFVGCTLDGFRTYGVTLGGTGTLGEIRFVGTHIHGQAGAGWTATGPAVALIYGGTAVAANIEFTGGVIGGSDGVGLYIGLATGTGRGIKVTGVSISDNNRGNHAGYAGVEIANGAVGVSFVGNSVHNEGMGHQKYSIAIAGALTDSIIEGNELGSVAGGTVETAPLIVSGALTRTVLKNNSGVDDVIGTIASGATIAAPLNPTFEVTGTTAITNITGGWVGREITLVFTNASPGGVSVGTGAGAVAKTQAMTQYQTLSLVYDGTKWYPGGGGAGGSGLGDVVGPAASVDGEVALYNSTTGKLIKRSALTGMLKSTSGVAAVAGANDVSGPQFCVSAVGSDAYACNLAPAIASYVSGTHYRFKADVANTGVATINLNSLATAPIRKLTGVSFTELATGDIRAGRWVDLVWDGTQMQIQSVLGNDPSAVTDAVTGAANLVTATRLVAVLSSGAVTELAGITATGGVIEATGFSGPLTGAVTGNASTATALAANPAACTNQVVTDIAANGTLTCASVVEDMLGLADVTTGNVSASAHGFAKKISVHATDDPTGACTIGQTYHNYATPSLWECVQTGAATTAWRLKLTSAGTGPGSIEFPTSTGMTVGAASTVKFGAMTGNLPGVSLNGGAVKALMATDTALLEAQHPAHDGDATSSAGDLTLALATKFKTLTKSVTLLDPVAGDSGSVQLVFGQAVTITRIWCSTKTSTSTVTMNLEERAEATPDTAGTEVLTSALVCDTDTQASTTFSNAGIAARVPLALTIASVANAPALVRVHLEYTID